MRTKVCVLQFTRELNYNKTLEKVKKLLKDAENPDFALIRGEFPNYNRQLKSAEVIFYSTMPIDTMMLDLAKRRTLENQYYFIMSSFIGPYVGMTFIGNAAILKSNIVMTKGMRMVNQTKVLQHRTEEAIIQQELDIDYIRKIRREYPQNEL